VTIEEMVLGAARGALRSLVERDWLVLDLLRLTQVFRWDDQRKELVEVVEWRGWKT